MAWWWWWWRWWSNAGVDHRHRVAAEVGDVGEAAVGAESHPEREAADGLTATPNGKLPVPTSMVAMTVSGRGGGAGGPVVTVHATAWITKSPIPETSTADLRATIQLQIGAELRKT
jgi:hypothetical protein